MEIRYSLSKVCKVIDGFTGKPLEKVHFMMGIQEMHCISKGQGVFIFLNMEQGCYPMIVTSVGYESKQFVLEIAEKEEILLLCMIPNQMNNSFLVRGKMKDGKKLLKNKLFYYTLDCQEYRKRLQAQMNIGEKGICLYSYDDLSLEGRKFAMEGKKGIYVFGTFDYIEKKYKLPGSSSVKANAGEAVYLLFESRTDDGGYFSIVLPKHLLNETTNELLFFLEKQSVRLSVDWTKESDEINVTFGEVQT